MESFSHFIELYQVQITIAIAVVVGLWTLYYWFCKRNFEMKIAAASDDIALYTITPVIVSIESPRKRRCRRDLGYIWKIQFKDITGDLKTYDFELDPNALPQSLIDEYRNFKKIQGTVVDKHTTDFADSGEVETKRLQLVQTWIEQHLPNEIQILQDKTNGMVKIEDPLLKYQGKINNDLRQAALKQSENGGRYLLLFIVVVFGSLILWFR